MNKTDLNRHVREARRHLRLALEHASREQLVDLDGRLALAQARCGTARAGLGLFPNRHTLVAVPNWVLDELERMIPVMQELADDGVYPRRLQAFTVLLDNARLAGWGRQPAVLGEEL